MGDDLVLLDLGSAGQRIRIVTSGRPSPDQMASAYTRARIEVEAHPFSGVIETIFSGEDLDEYRAGVESFKSYGRASLGGNRGPQVRLDRDGEVIEIEVTASGDDPWPTIKYLIFSASSDTPLVGPGSPPPRP